MDLSTLNRVMVLMDTPRTHQHSLPYPPSKHSRIDQWFFSVSGFGGVRDISRGSSRLGCLRAWAGFIGIYIRVIYGLYWDNGGNDYSI